MSITDQLAEIGKQYYYKQCEIEDLLVFQKTTENEAQLFIYQCMVQMLEKISVIPSMEVFVEYGSKIKSMSGKADLSEVAADINKINKLLKQYFKELID